MFSLHFTVDYPQWGEHVNFVLFSFSILPQEQASAAAGWWQCPCKTILRPTFLSRKKPGQVVSERLHGVGECCHISKSGKRTPRFVYESQELKNNNWTTYVQEKLKPVEQTHSSISTAVTDYYKLGGLKQHRFIMVLEFGSPKWVSVDQNQGTTSTLLLLEAGEKNPKHCLHSLACVLLPPSKHEQWLS